MYVYVRMKRFGNNHARAPAYVRMYVKIRRHQHTRVSQTPHPTARFVRRQKHSAQTTVGSPSLSLCGGRPK